MKTRTRILILCFVVLMLQMLVIAPANAGAIKTYFNVSETPLAAISPGVENFPDGRYHIRGAVDTYAFLADDPRLDDAVNQITFNGNFTWMPEPVYAAGRMWGKFVITNAGGYWEGTWNGVREENGYSYFHLIGKGGGGYEGMQLLMWGERLDPDPTVTAIYQGYIIEPGG